MVNHSMAFVDKKTAYPTNTTEGMRDLRDHDKILIPATKHITSNA